MSCVDDRICRLCDLCISFARSVYCLCDLYIACVIFIYIMICIGYARAHDVGAAHSECEASRLRMHIKNIAIFDEIGILAQFRQYFIFDDRSFFIEYTGKLKDIELCLSAELFCDFANASHG